MKSPSEGRLSYDPDVATRMLRVGLDIGFHSTVFQTANGLQDLLSPKSFNVPTWLAYRDGSDGSTTLVVGDEALNLRDRLTLIHPLESQDGQALRDFADALREKIDPEGGRALWGVVSCPTGASAEELKSIRLIANQIFERTSLLAPALLMATSFGFQEVARNSIWIDLGATSVRVALIHGGSPEPGETMVVPGGGNGIDQRLHRTLAKRFPDLLLTDVTVNQIKQRFAHVHPANPTCKLRILFDGSEKAIDIAPILRQSCEPIIKEILDGLRRVLQVCPSDSVEGLFENVVLAGGGAKIMGIGDRLREEVRREFGHEARVRIPDDPTSLVANGALRWAHFLEDEEWEIPLFSFAPQG